MITMATPPGCEDKQPAGYKTIVKSAFPEKLYDMLEDAEKYSFDHVVSWLPSGTAFKIHNLKEFAKTILPNYFRRQTRYKSFSRQLNLYGFKFLKRSEPAGSPLSMGGEQADNIGGFWHPVFCRGNRDKACAVPRLKKRDQGTHRHATTSSTEIPLKDLQDTSTFPARSSISESSIMLLSQEDSNTSAFGGPPTKEDTVDASGSVFNVEDWYHHPETTTVIPKQEEQEEGHQEVEMMVTLDPRSFGLDNLFAEEQNQDEGTITTTRGGDKDPDLWPEHGERFFFPVSNGQEQDSLADTTLSSSSVHQRQKKGEQNNQTLPSPSNGIPAGTWYERHESCLLEFAQQANAALSCDRGGEGGGGIPEQQLSPSLVLL